MRRLRPSPSPLPALPLLLAGCLPPRAPDPEPEPFPAPAPAPAPRPHVFAPPARTIAAARQGDTYRRAEPARSRPAPAARALPEGVVSIEASWYGEQHHGNRTASGERFDMNAMTAAHKTLPFGTRVRVIHPQTGASVEVRINDRCGRANEIDLAKGAAAKLGIIRAGRLQVEMEILR